MLERPGRSGGPVQPVPYPPFLGESQREAMQAIRGALAGRRAFVALTGAPGLGKTALLAAAVAPLPGLPLRTVRVGDPTQVSAELAARIERVALEPAERTPEGERHTVLVVDDAHAASPELLRCLARLAAAGGRPPSPRQPQVVLAGRPELWDRLASPEFAPLVRRITVRPVLRPMSDEDARSLIRRLLDQPRKISGQVLTKGAEQEVLHLAQGRPERIGAIVRSTLALGDIEARPPISPDMIRSAATALDGVRQKQGREGSVSARTLALALVAAAVVVAGGVVLTTQGWPLHRVVAAALDLANRAVVPWRTPPAGNTAPVLAEAARHAPVDSSHAAAPSSPAGEVPPGLPIQAPPPVSPSPARQDSADRSAAVGGDPTPRSRPPAPVLSREHAQPLALAGNLPTSAVPSLAARRSPEVAEVPGLTPVDAGGVAAPRSGPSLSIRAPDPVATANPGLRPVPVGTPPTPLSPETATMMLRRGDEMSAFRDYAAARHLYGSAVSAGSALGARGIARTYDPDVLGQGDAAADPVAATTWYGVAAILGDAEASARLQQVQQSRATDPIQSPGPGERPGHPVRTPAPAPLPAPAPARTARAAPPGALPAARMERAPVQSASATARANPAEAARLVRLAQAMATIGQAEDAREVLRAAAAMGSAQAERLLAQDDGR